MNKNNRKEICMHIKNDDIQFCYKNLTSNVKKKMLEKGYTQDTLADLMGISQANLSKSLNPNNKKRFTLDQVIQLAYIFECSIDELVGFISYNSTDISKYTVGSFLSQLLEKNLAKVNEITKKENAYVMEFNDYSPFPEAKHYPNKAVHYISIYIPDYWPLPHKNEIDYDFELSEALEHGNCTPMYGVNDFLRKYCEIRKNKDSLSEETYKAVISDLLNHLRFD